MPTDHLIIVCVTVLLCVALLTALGLKSLSVMRDCVIAKNGGAVALAERDAREAEADAETLREFHRT